jgi:hypothetical protein
MLRKRLCTRDPTGVCIRRGWVAAGWTPVLAHLVVYVPDPGRASPSPRPCRCLTRTWRGLHVSGRRVPGPMQDGDDPAVSRLVPMAGCEGPLSTTLTVCRYMDCTL